MYPQDRGTWHWWRVSEVEEGQSEYSLVCTYLENVSLETCSVNFIDTRCIVFVCRAWSVVRCGSHLEVSSAPVR